MTEFFVRNRKQEEVCYESRLDSECVCDWRSFFREVCMDMFNILGGSENALPSQNERFARALGVK
jgi:hypothetical protein